MFRRVNRWIKVVVLIAVVVELVFLGIKSRPQAAIVAPRAISSPMYAYMITGNSIQMINVDSTPPKLVGSPITGFDSPTSIAVASANGKNYAYVANIANTVSKVDLNLNPPRIIDTISGFKYPKGIAISGGYGYVVEASDPSVVRRNQYGSLVRFDLNSGLVAPSSRVFISTSDPKGIVINNGIAYISNGTNYIEALQPISPAGARPPVCEITNPGVTKYDISHSPPSPVISTTSRSEAISGTVGYGYAVAAINDGILYSQASPQAVNCALPPTTSSELKRINLSNDSVLSPVRIGGYPSNASLERGLAFYNGRAYVVTNGAGLLVVNMSTQKTVNTIYSSPLNAVAGIAIAPGPPLLSCGVAPNQPGAVTIGPITTPTVSSPNTINFTVTGGNGLACSPGWVVGVYPDKWDLSPSSRQRPATATTSVVVTTSSGLIAQRVSWTSDDTGEHSLLVDIGPGDVAKVTYKFDLSSTHLGENYNIKAYVSNPATSSAYASAPFTDPANLSTAVVKPASWKEGVDGLGCRLPSISYGGTAALSRMVSVSTLLPVALKITNNDIPASTCSRNYDLVLGTPAGWTIDSYSSVTFHPVSQIGMLPYLITDTLPGQTILPTITLKSPTGPQTNAQLSFTFIGSYSTSLAEYDPPTIDVVATAYPSPVPSSLDPCNIAPQITALSPPSLNVGASNPSPVITTSYKITSMAPAGCTQRIQLSESMDTSKFPGNLKLTSTVIKSGSQSGSPIDISLSAGASDYATATIVLTKTQPTIALPFGPLTPVVFKAQIYTSP